MPSTSVLMWFASNSLSCFSVASGLLFLASHVRGTHLFLGMTYLPENSPPIYDSIRSPPTELPLGCAFLLT